MRTKTPWVEMILLTCILLAGCSAKSKTPEGNSLSANPQAQKSLQDKDLEAWGRGDKWVRTEKTDQMDGHTESIYMDSAVGEDGNIAMVIICGPKLYAYVKSGPPENGDVRTKFDEAPPERTKWMAASNLISPPSANDFVKKLSAARNFKIEYTPRGGTARVENFKVTNLKELLSSDKNCKL
jgi:hypothetical protein